MYISRHVPLLSFVGYESGSISIRHKIIQDLSTSAILEVLRHSDLSPALPFQGEGANPLSLRERAGERVLV